MQKGEKRKKESKFKDEKRKQTDIER